MWALNSYVPLTVRPDHLLGISAEFLQFYIYFVMEHDFQRLNDILLILEFGSDCMCVMEGERSQES